MTLKITNTDIFPVRMRIYSDENNIDDYADGTAYHHHEIF